MEWTTDEPTQVGWYWFWDGKELRIGEVGEAALVPPVIGFYIGDYHWNFYDFTHFMGPIPAPEPPMKDTK